MHINTVASFFLIFILILPSVYPEEDFIAASTDSAISLCTLSSYSDEIVVFNTGDFLSDYKISFSGDGALYAAAAPREFSLEPGEEKTVGIIYSFPNGAEGEHDISIDISTFFGIQKYITKRISANLCNDNTLLLYNFNQTACPCVGLPYNLTIYNSGEIDETYVLGLDAFSEYANITMNPVFLAPGESKDLTLTINPSCDIYGEYIVNVFSNALASGIKASAPILLNINKCYGYSIDTGKILVNPKAEAFVPSQGSYEMCAGDQKYIQVRTENPGYIGNSFAYSLVGPEWVRLNINSSVIEGYSSGAFFLETSPSLDAAGQHKLLLSAESGFGKERLQKTINIDVNSCHGLIIDARPAEICSCLASDIPLNITNTGSFKENVILNATGSYASLLQNSLSINSGNSSSAFLRVNPPCDFSGNTKVTLIADLGNGKAHAAADIPIEVKPIEACYSLDINAQGPLSIGYGKNEIPIHILHKGSKAANYSVKIEAESWIRASTYSFRLSPGEQHSFLLLANPGNASSGTYYANILVQSENVVYKKTIKLRLSDSPSFMDNLYNAVFYNRFWLISFAFVIILLVIAGFYAKEKIKVWKIRRLIKRTAKTNGKVMIKNKLLLALGIILLLAAVAAASYFAIMQGVGSIFSFLLGFAAEYLWYMIAGFVILAIVLYFMNKAEKK